MADAIGSLGLDTGEFDRSINGVISNLGKVAEKAYTASGSLTSLAAVVGIKIVQSVAAANTELKRFSAELDSIKNKNPFSDTIVSAGELERRIGSLRDEIKKLDNESVGQRIGRFVGSARIFGGSGFDDSEEKRDKQRAEAARLLEDNLQKIEKQERLNLQVIELERGGETETAALLKNQIKYREEIGKALEKEQYGRAVTLAHEKKITDEIIKQNALRDRNKVTSAVAEDQARGAIGELLGDQKNAQIIADREAEKDALDSKSADREEKKIELMKEELSGENELTRLARVQFEYAEKIEKAQDDGLPKLAKQLEIEQGIAEQSIKIAAAKERALRASSIASEQAGVAIGALLGDQQNDQTIKDRDAQKKQDEMDFFHQQELLRGNSALEGQAQRDKALRDLARSNRQSASDAATQTAIGSANQSGRKPFAKELEVRSSFLQRKREAIANHNDAELKEIEAQEQQALRDSYAAESRQTPGDARADRRDEHRRGIEASRQKGREEELRRRGARGESSRAIDDQRTKDEQRAKFGAETDIARREAMQVQSWNQGDSTNLSTIAKAYEAGLK